MSFWQKVAILLVCTYSLLSANISGYPIYIRDEVKNVQTAREMSSSGEWIIPTFNAQLRTAKPPFHYYFISLGIFIFGDGLFGSRIFSVLFGTATIFVIWLFTRKFRNERTANYTALVLLSSLGVVSQFHLATPDPFLIFFLTGAFCSYYCLYTSDKSSYLYCFYTAIAFGFLSKGPIGLVLPTASILVFHLFKKTPTRKWIKQLNPLLGIVIFLSIAAPWFILVHLKTNGEWTYQFFVVENVHRFLSPTENHGGSFFLTIGYAALMLLPFCFFIPKVLISLNRKNNDLLLFCIVISIVIIGFFSISQTKLPNYIVPAVPFLGILLGDFFSREERPSGLLSYSLYLVPLGLVVFLFFVGNNFLAENPELAGIVDLPVMTIGPLILCLVALFFLLKKKIKGYFILCGASFILLNQLFFYAMVPKLLDKNPVAQTGHIFKPNYTVLAYKHLNPAFVYELNQEIPIYHSSKELENVDTNTLILTRPEHLPELSSIS
ncbi:MAG: glycosyltransferase family 39 protein, partial [Bacteroidota bacterium]